MLKKKVLVNGISNLSDARYCAGMGVDFLSFELNENHDDFISIDKILEIKKWLSGAKIGGRMSEWPDTISNAQWEELELDFIIISDSKLKEKANSLVESLMLEIDNDQECKDLSTYDALIAPSNNEYFESNDSISMFVTYKRGEKNTIANLLNSAIDGLSLRSGRESRPGFSNYDLIMDVLEELEED